MASPWVSLDLSTAVLLPTSHPYGVWDGTGITSPSGNYPDFRVPAMPILDPTKYYDFEVTYDNPDNTFGAPNLRIYSQKNDPDYQVAYSTSSWYTLGIGYNNTLSFPIRIGPGHNGWTYAVNSNEMSCLFESTYNKRLIGLRWREGDPPQPPPVETVDPGKGSDNWQYAHALPFGMYSAPTPSAGKTADVEIESDDNGYGLTRTVWWYIDIDELPVDEDGYEGGYFRIDTLAMTDPDTRVYVQIFGPGEPSADTNSDMQWGGDYNTQKLDSEFWVYATGRYYFKLGIEQEAPDVEYIFRAGPLIEIDHEEPVIPDKLPVRMWFRDPAQPFGYYGVLNWGPRPVAGEVQTIYDTQEAPSSSSSWTVLFNAAGSQQGLRFMAGAQWQIFNFGHDDWSVYLPEVQDMVPKNQDGTGVTHGDESTRAGATYFGAWGGMPEDLYNGNLGGFTRREWGHIFAGGAGNWPFATTFSDGVTIANTHWFQPGDPDLTGAYYNPWTIERSGLTNPFGDNYYSGYHYSSPGVLSRPRLYVATTVNIRHEATERIIIGIVRAADYNVLRPPTQSDPPTFWGMVNALKVMAVFDPPSVPQTPEGYDRSEMQVYEITLPSDFTMLPGDQFVAVGSPSVSPAWGSLPSESGFSPASYPPSWADRWGSLKKTYPDFSIDGWQFDVGLAFSFVYDYQPPTVVWTYTERQTATADGEIAEVGRLKLKIAEATWKFMSPYPHENDGFGRAKVMTPDGWQHMTDGGF